MSNHVCVTDEHWAAMSNDPRANVLSSNFLTYTALNELYYNAKPKVTFTLHVRLKAVQRFFALWLQPEMREASFSPRLGFGIVHGLIGLQQFPVWEITLNDNQISFALEYLREETVDASFPKNDSL